MHVTYILHSIEDYDIFFPIILLIQGSNDDVNEKFAAQKNIIYPRISHSFVIFLSSFSNLFNLYVYV